MDQTSGTNPSDAQPAPGPQDGGSAESPLDSQPGFRTRGAARRRARFLRRARELAYRDLGGLVFNLHRFGQRNDALVLTKLGTLTHIDNELRAIEAALGERRPVTVLREAGITACPRCAAIHGSEDRFCPNCGLPMSRHADLPVAGAPAGDAPSPPQPHLPQPQQPQPQQPQPFAQQPAGGAAPMPAAGRSPVQASRAAVPPGSGAEEATEIVRPHAPGT